MTTHLPKDAREQFVEQIAAAIAAAILDRRPRSMDTLAADRPALGSEERAARDAGAPAMEQAVLLGAGESVGEP
jgi:methionine synthase II (cobalamin-independent)